MAAQHARIRLTNRKILASVKSMRSLQGPTHVLETCVFLRGHVMTSALRAEYFRHPSKTLPPPEKTRTNGISKRTTRAVVRLRGGCARVQALLAPRFKGRAAAGSRPPALSRQEPSAVRARASLRALGLSKTLIWGLTVALLLAEILNVVQVFIPAHAVTVCYCCYCCSAGPEQAENGKKPG